MNNQKAIVIGGGIHGISVALALAEADVDVTIVEKNKRILQGTSGATHNRAHMGYHYPRSIKTAEECARGLKYFKLRYAEALYYPKEAYYAIAKEGSKTSSENYVTFCEHMQLPYKSQWPPSELLSRDHLDSSFLVPEPCFNLRALHQLVEKEAAQKEITIKTGSTVIGSERKADGTHTVTIEKGNIKEHLKAAIVINATYAYSNNMLNISGLGSDRTEYYYHTTEVVRARSNKQRLPALTVMDGPFISVMPCAGYEDLYLVYDVVYSVVHKQRGLSYEEPTVQSNWRKMIEHGGKYFPFLSTLEFVKSLWGSRPVPVDDTIDSRSTRIVPHKTSPGFYSILEGKFISAPLVAQELVAMIREDGLIK